jgi:membrane protein
VFKAPRWFSFVRTVVQNFIDDDAMALAAAIAFYTALSFAPLVLLLFMIGGFLGDQTQNDLIRLFSQQLGPKAGDVTRNIIENASDQPRFGTDWRWFFGTGMLLITSSGVFGQLQAALNRVWDVAPSKKKDDARTWWVWLRKRLLSMGMVVAVFFILLTSLVISTVFEWLLPRLGPAQRWVGGILVPGVSFTVAFGLFAAMFKILPDVQLRWRDVWMGALFTAALFTVGKIGLAIYLDEGGVGQDYGNATGGLIALLVWVYYSSITLLLGAEVTQEYTRRSGYRAPSEHAESAADSDHPTATSPEPSAPDRPHAPTGGTAHPA